MDWPFPAVTLSVDPLVRPSRPRNPGRTLAAGPGGTASRTANLRKSASKFDPRGCPYRVAPSQVIAVPDIYGARKEMEAEGVNITRPPGPMKHGTTVIAFIEDPDGYKVELIERK